MQAHVLGASGAHLSRSLAARPRASVVRCSCSYSFAELKEPRPEPGQRRVRALMKREERALRDLVVGMTKMTEKQLKAVQPVCGEAVVEAVKVAARLPRTNQGRKRQEQLVAKLLRTQLDELALSKLEEAVELSRTSSNAYVDRGVQEQAEAWRDALLEGDQDALQDVLQHLLAHQQRSAAPRGPQAEDEAEEQEDEHVDAIDEEAGPQDGAAGTAWAAPPSGQLPSPQQLRALVRQCQQARAELQQLQAPLAPASSNSFVGPGVGRGGQSGGGGDEDDLQSVLAEAAARARRRNKGGGGGSPAQEEASAAAAPARGGRGAGAGAAAVVDAAVGAASPALDAALRKSRLLNRSLYGVLRALAQAAGQEA